MQNRLDQGKDEGRECHQRAASTAQVRSVGQEGRRGNRMQGLKVCGYGEDEA